MWTAVVQWRGRRNRREQQREQPASHGMVTPEDSSRGLACCLGLVAVLTLLLPLLGAGPAAALSTGRESALLRAGVRSPMGWWAGYASPGLHPWHWRDRTLTLSRLKSRSEQGYKLHLSFTLY